MITKKNFDVLVKVFGTKKLEGVMPFAYVDGMGLSLRSWDALHTIFISTETAGKDERQISYTMLVNNLSQMSSFDDVSIGTDATVSLYDSAAQQDYVLPMGIEGGEYKSLLGKMQATVSRSKEIDESNSRDFFIEDKAQIEEIALFIQEKKCYMSLVDFSNIQKMAHLFIDEDVYVSVIPEENTFVIYNKFVTYMTDNTVLISES